MLFNGAAQGLAVTGAVLIIEEDDDPPNEVRLTVSPSTVSDADHPVQVRVEVGRWHEYGHFCASPTTVNVEAVAGAVYAATEGSDYTAIDDFTMTLIGTNSSDYVTLDQLPDKIIEGNETIDFRVKSAWNQVYGEVAFSQGATLTIEDNEPRIEWTLNKTSVDEDGGEQELEITANLAEGLTLSIDTVIYVVVGEDTSGGYPSARLGLDFDPVTSFPVRILAGANASDTVKFILSPIDDQEEEGDETLALIGVADDLPPNLCPTTNCFYTIPAVVATITDDDLTSAGPGTLIQVSDLDQLNAIRWDLNGDGVADNLTDQTSYDAAFPGGVTGCTAGPSGTCEGYRLTSDLDFDTNGDGVVDAGDGYWNLGSGWEPIGDGSNAFSATFDGAGYTIHNLFIARSFAYYVALFGNADSSAVIRSVGLESVNVTGNWHIGALVGQSDGSVATSYATGTVSGNLFVGGLVAYNNNGSVSNSYARVDVKGSGANNGGLVGYNYPGSSVTGSYATGTVAGSSQAGGLVGYNNEASITNSYATGRASASGQTVSDIGGLVGSDSQRAGVVGINDSYWDTVATCGTKQPNTSYGKTTSELRAPTSASGIYANWEGSRWDFGSLRQNPVLKADFNGDGQATWGEFGNQRPGPIEPTFDSITETVSELTVQWNKPCWDGGSDITSYDLRYILSSASAADKADDSNWAVETGVRTSGDLEYEISDLLGGESYDVQVRGVSENGDGAWSSTQTGTPLGSQQPVTEIILSVSPVSLDERDGPTEVTVTATHEETPPASPATVTLSPGGSAAPGADYYAVITGATVTIPANQPSATAEVDVTPVKDLVVEGDETIQISGTSAGYTVTPASITLVDAEAITTVAFESASYAVVEAGAAVLVTVTIHPAVDGNVAIPIEITPPCETGSAPCTVVSGLTTGTLTIAGRSGTASFTLQHTTDTDLVDEMVELSFGTLPDGITGGTPTTATVNLEDSGASLFDDLGQGDEAEEISIDVLTNDTGITGVPGSTPIVTDDPEHGDVVVENTGEVTYKAHDEDFNGQDQFKYEVQGTGESATVMVQVGPVNDPPEALGNLDDEEMDEEEPPRQVEVVENFRDRDGDPLIITASIEPEGYITARYENPVIIDPEAVGRTMVFDEGDAIRRNLPENTPAGAPVTASDADGSSITYSLVGPDSAFFSIDANTGQIGTVVSLDFEDP